MGPRKVPISLEDDESIEHLVEEPARDPRDKAAPPTPPAASSRSISPYTKNPTVDYDGLSWPSKCSHLQADSD